MKFNTLLNNFSSGEWSERMKSRSDTQQYFSACETLQNFIPQIQGGVDGREGSTFISDVTAATYATPIGSGLLPKIIPYTIGGISYQLYAAGTTTNLWRVEGVDLSTHYAVNSYTGSATWTDPSTAHWVQVGNVLVIVDGTGLRTPLVFFLSGGTFRIQTLYYYLANNSFVYESKRAYPYRRLEALSSSVTMTSGAATGATTLTASAAYFNALHVGALFKLSDAASSGIGIVTGFTSTTIVDWTVLASESVATVAVGGSGNADSSWEESAWSDYRGWPKSVTSYEGRLIYGGSPTHTETLFGSRIGNVFDMMERPREQDSIFTGYTDDNSRPFQLIPSSNEVSNIRSLSSSKTLFVSTEYHEINASGTQLALGPNDLKFESSSSFGGAAIMPARIGNSLLFAETYFPRVREFLYNFDQDQYKSNDLSFAAEHLFKDDDGSPMFPVKMVVDRSYNTVWVLLQKYNASATEANITTKLLGLVFDRDYQLIAWFPYVMGSAKILDVSIGGSNNGTTTSWMYFLTQRSIGGSYKYYVEINTRMSDRYFDCEIDSVVKASATNVYTGLDKLNGIEVQILNPSGQYIGTATPSGGSVTLAADKSYTYITVGIKIDRILKTMSPQIGNIVPNSPNSFIRRIHEATIKFRDTRGAQYGHDEDDLTNIDFKSATGIMSDGTELFSGDKTVKMPTDYGREAQVIVKQDKPFPCNITSIALQGVLVD